MSLPDEKVADDGICPINTMRADQLHYFKTILGPSSSDLLVFLILRQFSGLNDILTNLGPTSVELGFWKIVPTIA